MVTTYVRTNDDVAHLVYFLAVVRAVCTTLLIEELLLLHHLIRFSITHRPHKKNRSISFICGVVVVQQQSSST